MHTRTLNPMANKLLRATKRLVTSSAVLHLYFLFLVYSHQSHRPSFVQFFNKNTQLKQIVFLCFMQHKKTENKLKRSVEGFLFSNFLVLFLPEAG